MNLLAILPLAIVMIAGPQIISATLLTQAARLDEHQLSWVVSEIVLVFFLALNIFGS